METKKADSKKNDRKLSPQELLVQSPGDSDGISAEVDGSRGPSARGMEVRGASETENTADPATGREWTKHDK